MGSLRLLTEPYDVDAIFADADVREQMYLPLDWSGEAVLRRGCRVWGFDGGAFIVSPQADGTAQVHVGVLPEARGARAVEAARAAIACEVAAGMTLRGRTPKSRPEALRFALDAGMRYVGETEHEWITEARHGD